MEVNIGTRKQSGGSWVRSGVFDGVWASEGKDSYHVTGIFKIGGWEYGKLIIAKPEFPSNTFANEKEKDDAAFLCNLIANATFSEDSMTTAAECLRVAFIQHGCKTSAAGLIALIGSIYSRGRQDGVQDNRDRIKEVLGIY